MELTSGLCSLATWYSWDRLCRMVLAACLAGGGLKTTGLENRRLCAGDRECLGLSGVLELALDWHALAKLLGIRSGLISYIGGTC